MIIHVIQRGETLWQVANRYGVSISQIVTANELPNADRLVIGQALVIPVAARQHTVRTGKRYGKLRKDMGFQSDPFFRQIKLVTLRSSIREWFYSYPLGRIPFNLERAYGKLHCVTAQPFKKLSEQIKSKIQILFIQE